MGLFFQRKNGREDGAINRVGIRGKDEVGGGGGGWVIKRASLYLLCKLSSG